MASIQNLYKRGDTYWWRMMIDGELHRLTTGHKDFDLAKNKASELEYDIRSGAKAKRDAEAAKVVMPTYGAWVLQYFKDDDGAKSPNRKGAEERDPPALKASVKAWGDMPLDTITKSHCKKLYIGMLVSGLAVGTAWLYCTRVKLMFSRAIDAGLITKNPWAGVEIEEGDAHTRVLAPDEQIAVVDYFDKTPRSQSHWGRFADVACGTGLRLEEMLSLKEDHRTADGTLELPKEITKGSKARMVPLRADIAAILDIQPVGGSGRYWRYGLHGPGQAMTRAWTALDLPHFTPHAFRRTFGTRCAEAGLAPIFLKEIMGHADLKTTMKYYIHLNRTRVRDSLQNLDL